MTILSLLPAIYSGFLHQGTPFLQSKFAARVGLLRDGSLTPQKICRVKIKQKYSNHISIKFSTSASRNDNYHISYDDSPEEPFLLALIKESLCTDQITVSVVKTRRTLSFSFRAVLLIAVSVLSDFYVPVYDGPPGLKSLFAFLIEQPSQLKYIEWPSFSNTLRTATLTLVIVAFLLVALSSVDSALSYLLNLTLRKST